MKDFRPSPQGSGRAVSRGILIAVMLRKALSGSRVRRDQKEQFGACYPVCYPDEGLDQGGGGDRGGQVQEQEKSVCIRAFQGHGTESYVLLLFFL